MRRNTKNKHTRKITRGKTERGRNQSINGFMERWIPVW